jgi:competence ComEA-like helix-hairpin-helix protein
MPTPSEQKALAFVALVILLGGAVRVVRGGALAPPAPTLGEQQALARQAFAANSTAADHQVAVRRKGRKARGLTQERRDTGAAGLPTGASQGLQLDKRGFPPPYQRIDTDVGSVRVKPTPPPSTLERRSAPERRSGLLDLDTATEQEIDALPHVGPSLARRIVANRDSLGPFGSIAALRRVRGIGPATLERLGSLVTFSGQTRR